MIINVTSWEEELGGKMTLICGEEEGTSNFETKIQCYKEQRNKSLQSNVALQ